MLKYFGIILLLIGVTSPFIYYRKMQEKKVRELDKYLQIVNKCSTNTELFANSLTEILKSFDANYAIPNSKNELILKIKNAPVPERAKAILLDYFSSFGSESYTAECKKSHECKGELQKLILYEKGEMAHKIEAAGALVCAVSITAVILLL